ncbi:MAG: hypothetical protein FWH15_06335 [Betaproteobacteria bacterium]|nr:hypothetical protein [Betaproteobacteria bacterium]
MSKTEQRLLDYLAGYTRNNPNNLAHVIEYPDWQRMARHELDRRAARMLETLQDDELRAIATGSINLADLARRLPA